MKRFGLKMDPWDISNFIFWFNHQVLFSGIIFSFSVKNWYLFFFSILLSLLLITVYPYDTGTENNNILRLVWNKSLMTSIKGRGMDPCDTLNFVFPLTRVK